MGFFDFLKRGESAADRAAWLDTAIRGAASHAHDRYLKDARTAQRSFEAAETPAWTDSWAAHASNINDDLARQLPTMRARAHGLGRNNEWAISYLIKLDDNVLGEQGIRLQMRLKDRNGQLDKTLNAILEEAFYDWGEDCEVSGMSWRDVESVALAALPQDGEILYRFVPGAGRYGFQIQLLDASVLDVNLHRTWGSNRIRMGVEITDTGLPVAYWLRATRVGDSASDLIAVGRHVRVPADQVRHCFLKREVGQLRGYPWLAGGARRLWLTHDFEESAAVASSNAAKRQGFFFSPTGEAPPGFADTVVSSVLEAAKNAGKVLSPDEIQAITAAADKYATTVPGQFDTLPLGYQFQAFESQWPNIQADSYIKQQLRGWAAARGASYVSLGNDLEAVNYSSAQVGIVGERDHYKSIQRELRDWLHAPVLRAVLPYLVLKTPALRVTQIPVYVKAATWQPRRWQPVDPVKTANANETNLRLKLTSRRRIILERGDDPDEIQAENAEEEKLYGPLESKPASTKPADDDAEEKEADGGKKAKSR